MANITKAGSHITNTKKSAKFSINKDKAPLITERAVFKTASIELEDMEEIMNEMHNDIGLAYCILCFDNPRAKKGEIINALTQIPAPRYYVNIRSRTYWDISYMLRNDGRKKDNPRIRLHAKRSNDLYERYLAIAPPRNQQDRNPIMGESRAKPSPIILLTRITNKKNLTQRRILT